MRVVAVGASGCADTPAFGLDTETAADRAQVFKALADPARLILLSLIADEERCVLELTRALKLQKSTISYHLKVLRLAGLVDSERCGNRIFYRVIPEALQRLSSAISACVMVADRPASRC